MHEGQRQDALANRFRLPASSQSFVLDFEGALAHTTGQVPLTMSHSLSSLAAPIDIIVIGASFATDIRGLAPAARLSPIGAKPRLGRIRSRAGETDGNP